MMVNDKIICKHSAHKAQDQELEYFANPADKTLDVYVDAMDTMLLKWFLYIHAPSLISPRLTQIDDYKIKVIVRDQCKLNARLYRSEHDSKEDTVVLTPI